VKGGRERNFVTDLIKKEKGRSDFKRAGKEVKSSEQLWRKQLGNRIGSQHRKTPGHKSMAKKGGFILSVRNRLFTK